MTATNRKHTAAMTASLMTVRGTTRMAAPFMIGALVLSLAGCGQNVSKADIGTGIGALTGGLLGSQFGKGTGKTAATILGAVVGGVVGSQIGKSMDIQDRQLAAQTEYRALETGKTGQELPWKSQRTQARGVVVPGRYYQNNGRYCRQYTHTIYIDGRPRTLRGTACRQPDGTWRNMA